MTANGYSYKIKMEREKFRTRPFYHYENGQFSSFNIPEIIEDLKNDKNWRNGELVSVILLKSPSLKVLLTLLHEGTEVISYQSNDSTTFEVIEGSLILHIRNESVIINEGETLTLKEKIKFSFDTIEKTAFLMTLVSEKEFTNG
ncbi:MAG: hypothetical protein ACM3RX_05915 [Methanococcaceae archaeon]